MRRQLVSGIGIGMGLYFCLYLGLCLCLTSCASHQKIFRGGSDTSDLVFPMGTYQHEIALKVKGESLKNFSGVVQLKPDRIIVVGLSSFGTTVFKIQEDRLSGSIQTEIYVDGFKKFTEKLETFYKLIRELLILKSQGPQTRGTTITKRSEAGIPLEAEFMADGKKVSIYLSELDQHQIPARMELEQENFGVVVKVVGYDI